MIRTVWESNGLEAWRALWAEYGPALAARTTAMLSSMLNPTWINHAPFLDQLLEWERVVEKYESAATDIPATR